MKKKIKILTGILVVFFCILLGCERKKEQEESLVLIPTEPSTEEVDKKVEDEKQANAEKRIIKPDETDEPRSFQEVFPTPQFCLIHICGAVRSPGVYTFPTDSRIYEAVEAAGGFAEGAERDYLNQADVLTDGMKIYVPTKAELEETGEKEEWKGIAEEPIGEIQNQLQNAKTDVQLVNINLADEALLRTLPGIGASKANSIISYRQANGDYLKIEDIMCVEGIKEGLFQKIKDRITV